MKYWLFRGFFLPLAAISLAGPDSQAQAPCPPDPRLLPAVVQAHDLKNMRLFTEAPWLYHPAEPSQYAGQGSVNWATLIQVESTEILMPAMPALPDPTIPLIRISQK